MFQKRPGHSSTCESSALFLAKHAPVKRLGSHMNTVEAEMLLNQMGMYLCLINKNFKFIRLDYVRVVIELNVQPLMRLATSTM